MKHLAAVAAALLVVAACQAREEGGEGTMSDTGAPAMAPAPADTGMAGMDTGMKMGDTAMKKQP